MVKKKKPSPSDMPMGVTISMKPLTRNEIIKSEAKYLGQRIADTHPKVKKLRDEISRAVEGAVRKALSGESQGRHPRVACGYHR